MGKMQNENGKCKEIEGMKMRKKIEKTGHGAHFGGEFTSGRDCVVGVQAIVNHRSSTSGDAQSGRRDLRAEYPKTVHACFHV